MEKAKDIKVFDYFDTIKYIQRLKNDFPFLHTGSIGKSVMGREIPFIRIGRAK